MLCGNDQIQNLRAKGLYLHDDSTIIMRYLIPLITLLILVSGCTSSLDKYADMRAPTADEQLAFEKCTAEVDESRVEYDQCVQQYLEQQGFVDDVNCLENYEAECDDEGRYTAQVDADSSCSHLFDRYAQLECSNLLHNP